MAPIQGPWLDAENYDDFVYYYPTFQYAFGQIGKGSFPLWNPHQHCGTPFFATAQHLLLYPLNLFYLGLATPAAMQVTAILHVALAATFAFVLGRVTGLSTCGALTAGAVFGFSPALARLVYVPQHLYGATWLPLHLGLAHMILVRPRPGPWVVLLAVSLAAQYLGGYPQYVLFSGYLIAGRLAWSLVYRPGTAALGSLRLFAAAVLAVLLAAPQLLPALELAQQSPRPLHGLPIEAADPHYHPAFPALTASVRALALPAHGDPHVPAGHVGLVAFALAVLAPLARRRRALAAGAAVLVLFSLLLAVGRHTPLFALYFASPTGSWFRYPERFRILASLGLAILAGVGAHGLWTRASGHRTRRALTLILPLAVYGDLFLTFANHSALPETHPDALSIPPDVVQYLVTHAGYDRVYSRNPSPFVRVTPQLPVKIGMLYDLYAVADRENVFPARFADYVDYLERGEPVSRLRQAWAERGQPHVPQGNINLTSAAANLRLLDAVAVRYVVDGPHTTFIVPGSRRTFPLVYARGGYHVYENPSALPHVWVVPEAQIVPRDTILDHLASADVDLLRTVLLEDAPPDAPPAPGGASGTVARARITAYEPNHVTVAVASDSGGYLVLSDQYYPGWEARVDGAPASILRANYVFRAVPLPPGAQEVTFRFAPASVRNGVALFVLGLCLLLGWGAYRLGARGHTGDVHG